MENEIRNIILDTLSGRIKIDIEENLNIKKYNTLISVEQNVFGTIMDYRLYINETADIEEIKKSIKKQLYNAVVGFFFITEKYKKRGE